MERRLAAILAADVVGYSRLIRADEEGTIRTIRVLLAEVIDPEIAAHNGRTVKLMGDGLLLEFASAVDAVRAAVAMQDAISKHNAGLPEERRIEFRTGINLGDVVIDGDDIHGDGVNVAARLEGFAEPGSICISGKVYEEVRDRIELAFEDLGAQSFKNIDRPVPVWRLKPDASAVVTARKAVAPPPLPDKQSIVVLPFNNMSGDQEQEYFSDGITEDITTELSRFDELLVIARNTAFTFKDKNVNVTDVARELGVHFVLEGSVRRAGNRVRINTQLIDGLSGNHLWADRYDGSVEEVFDLQDQVTQQVVSATMPNIEDAAFARLRRGSQIFDETHDLAWQACDEVWEAWRKAQPVSMQAAKAKAYRAIELNAECHRAYFAICMATWGEILLQWSENVDETQSELKRMATTFVSVSPSSHLAYYCRGISHLMAGRMETGAQDLRHSIALNPNDSSVLSLLSYAEVQLDNLPDAKAVAKKAIRINPKDWLTGTAYLALAHTAFVEGDDQFRHWAEKAILAEPTAPMRRILMIAHAADVGDRALFAEHLEHLNSLAPEYVSRFLSGEAVVFRVPEHRDKIVQALQKAGLPN